MKKKRIKHKLKIFNLKHQQKQKKAIVVSIKKNMFYILPLKVFIKKLQLKSDD